MPSATSFLAFTLVLSLVIVNGGCVVAPGSATAFIAVKGQLSSAGGAPISGQPVKVAVPGGYGLTVSEHALATPDLIRWFESLSTTRTRTDGDGIFAASNSFAYHVDVWIFPRLGARPKYPPPPVLLIELSENQSDVYIVDLTVEPFRYRVVQRDSGRELPLDQAQWRLTEAAAKMDEKDDRNGWTVTITFQRTT